MRMLRPHRVRTQRLLSAGVFAAVLGLAVTGLAACGSSSDGGDVAVPVAAHPSFPSGSTMAELAKAGKITIGVKYDQPGFGELGLGGAPEGFDVEVGKIIAARLGISPGDITWKQATSDVREQQLERGESDVVIATYTINDERKKLVSFAGPYYVAGQQVMVKADDSTITGPDSFKAQPSAKVCSVTGSTPAVTIKQYLASSSQLVLFDDYSKCTSALKSGQVQAVTTDNAILLGLVGASDGAFKMVGDPFTEEPYGIGIKKGDTDFCNFIDTTLQGAMKDGSYTKAWESTAGKVNGARTPTLPKLDPCA